MKKTTHGRASTPCAPYSAFVKENYEANLSISQRLEIARECDRLGQKAKAAMIRSGLADLILKASKTNMRNYPSAVMQTVWRRIRKPSQTISTEIYQGQKPLVKADPKSPPNITTCCGATRDGILREIVRAVDLGFADVPAHLLRRAKRLLKQ